MDYNYHNVLILRRKQSITMIGEGMWGTMRGSEEHILYICVTKDQQAVFWYLIREWQNNLNSTAGEGRTLLSCA